MKPNSKWTDEYIREDLLITQKDDKLWKMFTKFFREEKGYDDWTDDEINMALNKDDIEEFIEYLKEEK